MKKLLLFGCVLLFSTALLAQQITISGKVTDTKTGDALPYVSVYVKLKDGTRKGIGTDFDGFYKLEIPQHADSISANYVGYKSRVKALGKELKQEINFQLEPDSRLLKEVRVTPKSYVNPAWEILRNIIKNKPANNYTSLASFQYQNYSRIELSVNDIGEKFKKRKFVKQIMPLMDSLKKVAGDDGKPVLPIFVSESISDYYYQQNPERKAEYIQRTKVNGVGIDDGTLISQLVGTTFQQYNFYSNYLKIAGKEFISPVSDSWQTFYDYELVERYSKIDGKEYFKIEFKPKREHDLAFAGVMWITQDTYAIYRMDATVMRSANLNFISKIKIQEEMVKAPGVSAWLPSKTRILVEAAKPNSNWAGLIAKFYVSNSDMIINKTYPEALFEEGIVLSKDINKKDEEYWNKNRHDSLTVAERSVYRMIDTIKNLPAVKSYIDIADMLLNGYYKLGKISFGPYLYTLGYNNYEGARIRLGFITNNSFSDKLILGGFVSYGTNDKAFKYGGNVDYIISRKPWTQAGISYSHDINQVALLSEDFSARRNNIFTAFTKNGRVVLRRPFMEDMFKAYIQHDILKGLTSKFTFSRHTFDPLYKFSYAPMEGGDLIHNYVATDLNFELKWSPGLRILQAPSKNKQITLRSENSNPVITFRYTQGLKNVLNSDFGYQKMALNISQILPMGILGKGMYSVTAGYIPSELPYPLLENHLGNGTGFYNRYAFNMMRFFEFTSDRFVSLSYTQNLEGLIFNSIPLIRSFNWRTVATCNVLVGDLSKKNLNYVSGTNVRELQSLNGKPYVEVGYGIENIFKFIRVDFIHRLTQLHHADHLNQDPKRFGVKVSAQLKL